MSLSLHVLRRYLLATGRSLVGSLAPWSKFVGEEQVLHLISALTESALAHLIEEVHVELRPILQRTLVVNPSHRWSIHRLMVRLAIGCYYLVLKVKTTTTIVITL